MAEVAASVATSTERSLDGDRIGTDVGAGKTRGRGGRFLVPGLRPLLRGISRVSFGTVQVDLSRNYSNRRYKYHYQDEDEDNRPMNQARVKIYRRCAFDPYVFNRKPVVDLAAGLQIGTDGEMLTPKCRLKVGPHMRYV